MTLFGLIWLVILLVFFLKFDLKKMAYLTIFSMLLQSTNVIELDSIMLGPQIITNFMFIFMFILKKPTYVIKKPTKFEISAFLILFSIIISSIYNNTAMTNIFKIVQIFIYILSFVFMLRISEEFDKKTLYKFIKNITIFVLVIGYIQVLSSGGFIPRFSIISELFFNDRSTNVYYWYDNYYRFTSVFMEPSYCSCFLVGVLFYFLTYMDTGKKNYILIIFIMISILLTKSSSGYVSLALCTLIFIIFSKNTKAKRILVPIAIFGSLILIIFFMDVLNEVIFSKSSSGSATTRYYWNKAAIRAFDSSKLLGIGYKNVRGSSIIYSLLGELGIIGLATYIIFNLQIVISLLKKSTYTNLDNAGSRFAVLAIIIIQIVACPDLDLCVYWLILDTFALYGNLSVSKNKGDIYETKKK